MIGTKALTKAAAIGVASAALASISMLSPSPAYAFSGNYYVYPGTPSANGLVASGPGSAACTGGNAGIATLRVRIESRSLANEVFGFYGSTINAKLTALVDCNGTGSRPWRVKATATDIYGSEKGLYGDWKTLVC